MLRRRLVGSVAVGLLACLASALLARPGTVRTKDGIVFTGDVTEDDKFVTIKVHGIPTRIDKRNVPADGIVYTATLDDQFNDRKSKLAASDVKGRIDLANWASENQRPDLAVVALTEATKIDPASRDAELLLDTAQRQVELDQHQKGPATKPTAAGPNSVSQPVTPVAARGPDAKPLDRRPLNADEVNIIRQKEMLAGDPKVQLRFEHDVIKKYLATGDRDADAFKQLAPVDQATEILDKGDPSLAKDVRILTDPTPMVEFKTKIYPIIASACGSGACHGGSKGGDFGLYPADSPSAIYTNFYILQTYSKSTNGTENKMLDRVQPDRSLFLNYALPSTVSEVAHPTLANYRPRFRSKTDTGYTQVLDWLQNSLNPIPPVYGIKVSAKLAATQASDAAGGPK